jgi:hypothetical protein
MSLNFFLNVKKWKRREIRFAAIKKKLFVIDLSQVKKVCIVGRPVFIPIQVEIRVVQRCHVQVVKHTKKCAANAQVATPNCAMTEKPAPTKVK